VNIKKLLILTESELLIKQVPHLAASLYDSKSYMKNNISPPKTIYIFIITERWIVDNQLAPCTYTPRSFKAMLAHIGVRGLLKSHADHANGLVSRWFTDILEMRPLYLALWSDSDQWEITNSEPIPGHPKLNPLSTKPLLLTAQASKAVKTDLFSYFRCVCRKLKVFMSPLQAIYSKYYFRYHIVHTRTSRQLFA